MGRNCGINTSSTIFGPSRNGGGLPTGISQEESEGASMDNLLQNAQNVVIMTDYQPDTGYSAISQVEAYWEALRGDRLMPSRSEIDPRGIEQALEFAFIVERIAPGIARMRVAGNHLSDILGMEVRGMPLTALFVPDDRRRLSDALEEVFETPAVATFALTASHGTSRPSLEGRMHLMPLKSDLGDVSRILGCIVVQGDFGTTPRRLSIADMQIRPIIPGKELAELKSPKAILSDAAKPYLPHLAAAKLDATDDTANEHRSGFGETAQAFGGRAKNPRPPYLRIVKTDK